VDIHNKIPIMGQEITITRGDKVLLDDISFQFPLGRTIVITGDNGSGKSSFLHEIMNHAAGIEISPKVKIGSYRQMDYKMLGDEPVLKYLMRHTEFKESLVRRILKNLGFSQNEVTKSLHNLSGGEATRVSLALMFVKPSNVIILDEPTNFIDLNTIEALEKFIDAYKGTVLVTSHDQYFTERVADMVFEIENRKLNQRK